MEGGRILNESAAPVLAGQLAPDPLRSMRGDPGAAYGSVALSRDPRERLLASALESLMWLSACALAFAFTVDEQGLIEVTLLNCAPGRDPAEAAAFVGRLRQLEAIDPFNPRRAEACRASLMSAADLGGVEEYGRSMYGQRLRRYGYGAPLILYLWRADRIVAGVSLLRGCDSPPFDAATVRLLRQFQPLLEDACGFAAAPRSAASHAGPDVASLTRREAEVARLVAGDAGNAEIARALGVSEVTVKAHLTNIYGKLGVRSRTQLALAIGDVG